MKVFISKNSIFSNPIQYIWKLFAANKNVEYVWTDEKKSADFIIDETTDSDLPITIDFYHSINNGHFDFEKHFKNDCIIRTQNNSDYLASAFYMINCLQEYNAKDFDELGRFRFSDSYQFKYGNIQYNLVQNYFDALIDFHPKLQQFNSKTKSKFFLSHDLDSINGALFQDGFHALKHGNPFILFKLFFNAAIGKPDWLNMDKIMKIESEYDFKSTFFWLVNKGKINKREVNSDYDISSPKIQGTIKKIKSEGFENGLHKSISSESFSDELKKIEDNVKGNRCHYLKFKLPHLFDKIEESGILMDASLGFAEAYGFRNSYGRPFHPYNFSKKTNYNFIEVPLHVMDGTFQRYLKMPCEKTADSIISFLETNKYDSVISILWHNTFFSDYKYKGYAGQYKKILSYLYESKFECINQSEIIKQYSWMNR